jgi:outer membrane protein assembly factor BamB
MLINKIRRVLSIWLLIAGMLLLTGCAGMDTVNDMMSGIGDLFADDDNTDPPTKLPEEDGGEYQPEIQSELLWSESVGKGADQKFLKLIPAVRAGRIYVASHDGKLQARSTVDGDLIWETETDHLLAAGPGLSAHLIIMGTSHGEVLAFDMETGQQKWSTTVSSEVLAVPVIAKGKVIVRTTDGKIFALREDDGSFVWSAEHSVPALSIRGAGSPLVVDDVIIVGGANGKLFGLQLVDGKALWESTIVIPSGRSEVERLVDLDVDPIESRSSVFISSYQGGTSAVSETDGEVVWRNENVSSYTGITADYRYLYISDTHSEVYQLDQRNGASLWKQKDLHNRQLSTAVVYDSFVVAGDYQGYVHWMSTNDGRLLSRIKVGKSPIQNKPVVADGIVFVYAKDGTLAALKAK